MFSSPSRRRPTRPPPLSPPLLGLASVRGPRAPVLRGPSERPALQRSTEGSPPRGSHPSSPPSLAACTASSASQLTLLLNPREPPKPGDRCRPPTRSWSPCRTTLGRALLYVSSRRSSLFFLSLGRPPSPSVSSPVSTHGSAAPMG